jgi:hypothetical protein
MHGAWGTLTMLIKKQEATKHRKAEIRRNFKNRKNLFIETNNKGELDFPKISNAEMALLKRKIRKEYRKRNIKKGIINALIFTAVAFVFYYLILMN